MKSAIQKNRRKLLPVAGGLLLVLLPVILYSLYHSQPAQAGWFDDSWAYRTRYSFTHNAALTDRRVEVTIDTATLITAGKMQSDCDDSRFTDINGLLLRLDLTGTCNNAATTYDVLFPTIINGGNAFYHYYGNPSAGSVSEDLSSYTSLSPSGGAPSAGSEEIGPGPIAYWKFDEGTDNTCENGTDDTCDIGVGKNDGVRNGATWQTEDMCKNGKCLQFDGTDDYVSVADPGANSVLDFDSGDEITIAFWFKATTIPGYSDQGILLGKGATTGSDNANYQIWIWDADGSGDNEIKFGYEQSGGGYPDWGINDDRIVENKWMHFAMTFTFGTSSSWQAYLNGMPVEAADGGADVAPTLSNDPLWVGAANWAGGASVDGAFDGFIDEVKIYPYARSADEIKVDYNKGAAASFGPDNSWLSNGLVGYWKMDDNVSGDGQTVTDSSGNSNNGTTDYGANTTGMDCTVPGKFGYGCQVDGTDDNIAMGSPDSLDGSGPFTASAWIKPTSDTGYVISKRNTSGDTGYWRLALIPTNAIAFLKETDDNPNLEIVTANNIFSTSQWNHVVVTFGGTTSASEAHIYVNGIEATYVSTTNGGGNNITDASSNFNVGSRDATSSFYPGIVDEVRYYQKALSPAEVSALYNWAPGPFGYWKLDEGQNDKAYDSSGNGITGTLGNTTTVLWRNGKFGNGIETSSFTSSTDRISLSTASSVKGLAAFTTEGWVYPTSSGTSGRGRYFYAENTSDMSSVGRNVVGVINNYAGCGAGVFGAFFRSAGQSSVIVCDPNTFSTHEWYHVAAVYNSVTDIHKLYVNGILVDTSTTSATTMDTGNPLNTPVLGNWVAGSGYNFPGIFDEVKLYSYERNPSQIISDMNAGHPAPGSPIGSPVLHLNFDEGYGDAANDSSPQGNNGDLQGSCPGAATCPSWTNEGKYGKALNYDGGDYISIADDDSLNPSDEITLSAWVNPSTLSGYDTIMSAFTAGAGACTGKNIYFYTQGGTVGVVLSGPQTCDWNSSVSISTGIWTHLAVTYNGSIIKLYKNGILEDSVSASGTLNLSSHSLPIYIGYNTAWGEYWDGKIDEVKIYNFALTADQVKAEMNQGKSAVFGATSTDSSGYRHLVGH